MDETKIAHWAHDMKDAHKRGWECAMDEESEAYHRGAYNTCVHLLWEVGYFEVETLGKREE